jgi:ribonuclease D
MLQPASTHKDCLIATPDTLQYIDDQPGLNKMVTDLCTEPLIAFDLEADSMFHFKEKICLIQIATRTACYIVDPLPIPDMSPLSRILSDEAITKIFHGADYDVRSLYRDYGIAIHNLFDTELASRFLGLSETGLDAVLKKRFNICLEKKYQKKDWSQRPLPKEMINYAAKDVHYLIPLYEALQQELKGKERLAWVSEECRDLTLVRSSPVNERPLFLKIKGAGHLDRRNLAVLEGLLEFRMSLAEQKDRPLFKVIGNASLLTIAQAKPQTMSDLSNIRALSEKQIHMYGHAMINIVQTALSVPDSILPNYPYVRQPRTSSDVADKFNKLKTWREQKAKDLCMDPGVLINNATLKMIAELNIKATHNLNGIPPLKNWQKNELWPEITTLLANPEIKNG